jgi:hypothetical protein
VAERWEYKTLLLGSVANGPGVILDDGQPAAGKTLNVHLNALAAQGWEVDKVIQGVGGASMLTNPTLLLRRLVSTEEKAGL